TASDNCPGVTLAQTGGPTSGSTFFAGVKTIEYTATDAAGNMTVDSFTVTVRGDFSDVSIYSTGASPQELVLADIDGVNGKDIVTANFGDDSLTIRLNDGLGDFSAVSTFMLPPGCGAVAVTAGEFVAGGGVDLAVACLNTHQVLVLENVSGTLSLHTIHDLFGVGLQQPFALAAGGLGAGALDDIAVACQGAFPAAVGQGVAIILDNSLVTSLAGTYRRPQDIAVGDLDLDGDLDVAMVEISTTTLSSTTNNVLLFENDGTGVFTLAATNLSTSILNPHSICISDLDANGIANDIAVACDTSTGFDGTVVIFTNANGAATFGAGLFTGTPTFHTAGIAVRDIACGDLQRDNLVPQLLCRSDVITANFGSVGPEDITMMVGYDCGTMTFTNEIPSGPMMGKHGSCNIGDGTIAVAMCDLNGDTLDDIVTVNQTGNFVAVFLSEIRAISTPFGMGCPGTFGIPQISGPNLAVHGQTATVMLSNAGNGAALSAGYVLGVSLGYTQMQVGTSSCISYLAPSVLVVDSGSTVGGAPGMSSFSFGVPAASMMIPSGLELYFQYAVFDSMGAFNSSLAFTAGLRVRLGN
ncbi:MAG: HYR domain-containing protein, partial [Planctomycetes bacterium]|nr:HYR domain-containing protein [Planctomycetota bacterium]